MRARVRRSRVARPHVRAIADRLMGEFDHQIAPGSVLRCVARAALMADVDRTGYEVEQAARVLLRRRVVA